MSSSFKPASRIVFRANGIALAMILVSCAAVNAEPLRTFYGGANGNSSNSSNGGSSHGSGYDSLSTTPAVVPPLGETPAVVPPIGGASASSPPPNSGGAGGWSKFKKHAWGAVDKAANASYALDPNHTNNGSPANAVAPNGGGNYYNSPQNVGGAPNYASQHLPSAMPNPAYQTPASTVGMSPQEAEHQRVLSNMRRAGYSDGRINAMEPYMHHQDAPGTTYRNVGGLMMRNDGMTPQQALHNVTSSGLMNTPISTDKNHYGGNEYGYYKNTGGRKTFDQWLHGER